MRIRRVKRWTTAVVAAGVMAVGVPAAAALAGSTGPDRAAEAYTAEEYLTGIYFGTGPVGEHLAQLAGVGEATAGAGAEQLSAEVAAQVASTQPAQLAAFRTEIASGDHARVASALVDGLALVQASLDAPEPVGETAVPGWTIYQTDFALTQNVHVHNSVTISRHDAITFAPQRSALRADQLVHHIATALAAG